MTGVWNKFCAQEIRLVNRRGSPSSSGLLGRFLFQEYEMKRCFKCGVEKDIEEFYKHPRMSDGHLGKCKECTKMDVIENYDKKIDRIKAYESERFKNPQRKLKVLEYRRKLRKCNPDKFKARQKLDYAVLTGKLFRKPCEVCGIEKSQAHHDDYSKPLSVRWLCFKHHRLLHGQRNL